MNRHFYRDRRAAERMRTRPPGVIPAATVGEAVHRALARLADLKGAKGGNCNRTDCQLPGATFYNKATQRYYCATCADLINWPGGRASTRAMYGCDLLCEEDPS